MSRPATVGDIPLGGGGFSWGAFIGGFVLALALVAGVVFHQRRSHRAAIQEARLRAEADSLDIHRLAGGVTEAERRAVLAEVDRDLERALREEAEASLARQRLRPRAVVGATVVAADTFVLEATAIVSNDTLAISGHHADSTFTVGFEAGVTGMSGDPRLVYANADVMARLYQQWALSCGEDGAPHAHLFTFDSRVSIEQMDPIVSEDLGCWPRPPAFFSIDAPVTSRDVILVVFALAGWAF